MRSIAVAAHRRPQPSHAVRPGRSVRSLRASLATAAFLLCAAVNAVAVAAAPQKGRAGGGGGSDLTARLKQSSVPVLVEFWAPWCGPCRRLEQPLAELAAEMDGRVRVVRVNIDSSPRTAERYGVELLPTMVVFDRGVELDRMTGVPTTSELRSRLGKLIRPAARESAVVASAAR